MSGCRWYCSVVEAGVASGIAAVGANWIIMMHNSDIPVSACTALSYPALLSPQTALHCTPALCTEKATMAASHFVILD